MQTSLAMATMSTENLSIKRLIIAYFSCIFFQISSAQSITDYHTHSQDSSLIKYLLQLDAVSSDTASEKDSIASSRRMNGCVETEGSRRQLKYIERCWAISSVLELSLVTFFLSRERKWQAYCRPKLFKSRFPFSWIVGTGHENDGRVVVFLCKLFIK